MTNRKNLLTNRIDTADKELNTPYRKQLEQLDNVVTKRMNRMTNVIEMPDTTQKRIKRDAHDLQHKQNRPVDRKGNPLMSTERSMPDNLMKNRINLVTNKITMMTNKQPYESKQRDKPDKKMKRELT